MKPEERDFVARYLTCMIKDAASAWAAPLGGLAAGAALGGLGGYMGTRRERPSEKEEDIAKRRRSNIMLGLLGGGTVGGLAGFVPQAFSDWKTKVNAPQGWASWLGDWLTGKTAGGAAGSLAGYQLGKKYVDIPAQHGRIKDFVRRLGPAAIGELEGTEGDATKRLLVAMQTMGQPVSVNTAKGVRAQNMADQLLRNPAANKQVLADLEHLMISAEGSAAKGVAQRALRLGAETGGRTSGLVGGGMTGVAISALLNHLMRSE